MKTTLLLIFIGLGFNASAQNSTILVKNPYI